MRFPIICSALLVFGTFGIAGVTHAQDAPAEPWTVDAMPPFDDVPTDHWAYQATRKLRDAGIVVGYPKGTFNNSKIDENANLPSDAWEYTAVDNLQRAGIAIDLPFGTLGGRRAMTRYEFAAAIARLVHVINENPAEYKDTQQEIASKLTQNPDALEAFRWLIVEFRPKLTQMGQGVPKAMGWLDAIKPPADELKQK